MGEQGEAASVGVDEGALAAHDNFADVAAAQAFPSLVFTLWPSIMQALGAADRPLRSPSVISSAWFGVSNTLWSHRAANQR
jgi:hypothetical protein